MEDKAPTTGAQLYEADVQARCARNGRARYIYATWETLPEPIQAEWNARAASTAVSAETDKVLVVKAGDAFIAPPGYTVIHSAPVQKQALERRYSSGEEACSSCGLTRGESYLLHDLKAGGVSLVADSASRESIAIAALREIKTIYGSMAAQIATEALSAIETTATADPGKGGAPTAKAAPTSTLEPDFFNTALMRVHLEHLRHCKASDLPSGTQAFFGFLTGEVERASKRPEA